MSLKSVLVTGTNGGIGTSICKLLQEKGFHIIGTDLIEDKNNLNSFITCDLRELVHCEQVREQFMKLLDKEIGKTEFIGLVNNSAVQILSSMEELELSDFQTTLNVNVIAPMVLSKICFEKLKSSRGSIINIGSIHSKLTKPRFISYATSKSALQGLTQSMAVDFGDLVRVNAILPAATATEMLLNGFEGKEKLLTELKAYHPSKGIAETREIAEAVAFLISDKCPFINGASLEVNGGIGVRLHDPA